MENQILNLIHSNSLQFFEQYENSLNKIAWNIKKFEFFIKIFKNLKISQTQSHYDLKKEDNNKILIFRIKKKELREKKRQSGRNIKMFCNKFYHNNTNSKAVNQNNTSERTSVLLPQQRQRKIYEDFREIFSKMP